jgi:hypothetical protein
MSNDAHITGGLTPQEWVNWRHPMMDGRDAAVSDESTIQPGIPPALTLEEWASARTGDHSVSAILQYLEPEDMPAIIAWANAALADGDPRKITRDDVKELIGAADGIDEEYGDGTGSGIRAVAAKLAALLPPE